jgi:Protein of unknown function (DUF1254)
VTPIRFPTAVGTIVGRWAVNGPADLPAVRELQSGLTLSPAQPGAGVAQADTAVPEELRFFEQLRAWMRAFPPAQRDRAYQRRFARLGLLAARVGLPRPGCRPARGPPRRVGRREGALGDRPQGRTQPKQNGWGLTYRVFDYNLDFFEIGAFNDPRWKLADGPAR